MIRRLGLVILLGLTACQVKPTRISESQSREFDLLVTKATKPLVLTESTVVLDARSSFDYGLSRVVGSHHFQYENLVESSESGDLLKDKRKLSQRLSLLGLTPDSAVVVVGNGPQGRGEDGRLAWTLLYLGFRDVQTASVEMFRKNLTQLPTPAPKNAPPFEIVPRDNLKVSVAEFKRWAANPKERQENRVWILDVRSEKEYFNKVSGQSARPDISALNIEWKQFYTSQGRPDPALGKRLQALGIRNSDRVLLIGENDGRSAAAAFALLSLGFSRAEILEGGWRTYSALR